MSGTAQDVPSIAADEVGVHWRKNEARILEYFRASTGLIWTKRDALTQSWCTHFVMWVLKSAKVDPIPPVGTPPPGNFSVGRFAKRFAAFGVYDAFPATGSYIPKPGDLYYLPRSFDHVGIIEAVTQGTAGAIMIMTINGNGFDQRQANLAQLVEGKMPLGGGFVSRNGPVNLLDGNAKHRDAFYIALPGP